MSPKKLKKEIEYKLGLYFGIKSGALGVKEGNQYGTLDEIKAQLEEEIPADVKYLSIKYLRTPPPETDFKSVCIYYKNHLMNL